MWTWDHYKTKLNIWLCVYTGLPNNRKDMLFNWLFTTKVYTKIVSKNKLHKIDIINQFINFIATFIVFLSKFKLIFFFSIGQNVIFLARSYRYVRNHIKTESSLSSFAKTWFLISQLCAASDKILPIQNLCCTSLLLILKIVNIGTTWYAYLMY